ncbi:GbsR/MarR family transcriptional regulator [Salinisphaera sp. Q1T1-3]|uniref:GbsR/MarR family transcriptional regulator n=1 Tax=Salinisphaera sp. Q1T1-3 TaxID=2321229 RepID=UPI000E748B4D|nr:MarR family transcriptional regulator [Salinisphaera sp. Q1T1-3]RJS91953.1 MarR family transcriptional regulator [Salinisphaera sp. Q1T1-3]
MNDSGDAAFETSAADGRAISAFIERMGLSAQGDGLPRIAGRILGYFIIHGGPTTLGVLARRLAVSRASISTNARLLRDLGFLEATAMPGDRQDYYQLAPRHYVRVLENYEHRMGALGESLSQAEREIDDAHVDAQARLADMRSFVTTARAQTRALIERLQSRDES